MKPRKNKTGGHQVYDDSLKIAVARDYLTGNLSLAQVAEKYNMPGKKDTVGHFVKWYRKHYQSKPLQTDSSPPVVNDIDQPKSSKELEKELSAANLKIAALEIMIQVAEEELGIEIRKKPGTKQ